MPHKKTPLLLPIAFQKSKSLIKLAENSPLPFPKIKENKKQFSRKRLPPHLDPVYSCSFRMRSSEDGDDINGGAFSYLFTKKACKPGHKPAEPLQKVKKLRPCLKNSRNKRFVFQNRTRKTSTSSLAKKQGKAMIGFRKNEETKEKIERRGKKR